MKRAITHASARLLTLTGFPAHSRFLVRPQLPIRI
jgi:hypothetical protein